MLLNIYSNIKKELESCGLKVAIKKEDESEDMPEIKKEFEDKCEDGEEQRGMPWMLSKIVECTVHHVKSKLTKVNINNSNLNDQLKMLCI